MKEKEIIEKLIQGYSLTHYLEPNEKIASNLPAYIEAYSLPYLVIEPQRRHFWAKSQLGHHLSNTTLPTSYCYHSSDLVFCHFNPFMATAILLNKNISYQKHEWILTPNATLVWDSLRQSETDTEAIRCGIVEGKRFKVAFCDDLGFYYVLPADLTFFYPDSKQALVKTVMDYYPQFLTDHEWVENLVKQHPDKFGTAIQDTSDLMDYRLVINVPSLTTAYEISTNGTYLYRHSDTLESLKKYRFARIYMMEP